ncbi:MAG: tetratricopeptide repeat protein [Desulfobacteraceae bacterium]|nr:tetratricopeptide repeat protein [Desulfobacteraceae bacterium]
MAIPSVIPCSGKNGPERVPAGLCGVLLACVFLLAACSRPPVYIPPETSHQGSYRPAPPPSQPQQPPPPSGGAITQTPKFKKQDIPVTPPPPGPSQGQPAPKAAPQPKPQTVAKPAPEPVAEQEAKPPAPKPRASKKQEPALSPHRQASMQLVNQAKGTLDRGKPDSAIPLLERAINIDAQNAEAFMLLARAWKQKNSKPKALEFAKKAELLYSGNPARLKEVYLLKADLYREMGDAAKAAQFRKKAAALR